MSFEVEIKLRIKDIKETFSRLKSLAECEYLGEAEKDDIYWAHDNIELFRTRLQKNMILFTSKPDHKVLTNGTEKNEEIEFSISSDYWDDVVKFFSSRFDVSRRKHKKGYEFSIRRGHFTVHAELFDVEFLGTFLEMEICPQTLDDKTFILANKCLHSLAEELEFSDKDIEPRSYKALLEDFLVSGKHY